jgi:hypothetical protein
MKASTTRNLWRVLGVLLILALALPLFPAATAQAQGGPVVSTGFDPAAVKKGVVRLRNLSASSILRWKEMVWGAEHGYAVCDLGGAGWPDKPYGVRDFKVKFGGQLVQFGRYRKVYAPWRFAFAERAYEIRRKVFASRSALYAGDGTQPHSASTVR